MTAIYLTSAYLGLVPESDFALAPYRVLRRAAAGLRGGHRLASSPEDADWILFSDGGPEPFFRSIRRSKVYRESPERVFVFCQDDRPIPLLRGAYASIERRWMDRRWVRSSCYLQDQNPEWFREQPYPARPEYLFSFAGSVQNAVIRQRLMRLEHPRGYLQDTSGQIIPAFSSGDERRAGLWVSNLENLTRQSGFVLCPRGVGCSTVRVFEAMKMGRAPVVISDAWVAPEGPRWERCSIRVRESDIAAIPRILEPLEANAEEMGGVARQEWERWFAPDVVLQSTIAWIESIRTADPRPSLLRTVSKRAHFLRPQHTRRYVREWRRAR